VTIPTFIQGDARNLPLADESVDLIVTSPPYFGLRDYGIEGQIGGEPTPAEFLDALIVCTAEMVRVLKPTGSIFINLGDKYSTGNSGQSGLAKLGARHRGGGLSDQHAKRRSGRVAGVPPKSLLLLPERFRIRAVDELGLIARAVVIWSKPNPIPESVTDRVRRSHEDWIHLTLRPRYYSSIDAIREPHTDNSAHARNRRDRPDARLDLAGGGRTSTQNPRGKLPGSVWSITAQPLTVPADLGIKHFAAFPMEWPRRLIKGWSPVGGVVLDPFSGTGTTAIVAVALGRMGIGVELSPDYIRLAQWRARNPGQLAKASESGKAS